MSKQPQSELASADFEINALIEKELRRQEDGLELIASENYASKAVIQAQGTILTNKYAEGYPGKRYYGGCEVVDAIEQLAIDRAKQLFGASFANVQPHSGSQANMGCYLSILKPGDKFLGMNLAEGGHLTHGSPVNFSGKLFQVISYGLNLETETIDYNKVEEIAKKERPKVIVAGASAYPRIIDFQKFKEIAKSIDAYFVVDMAHIAGLVATGLHPTPVGVADFVTSTTHKTLRGPRGGLILTNNEEFAKNVNFTIFPGIQGGPLEHVIAAKAVAFKEALSNDFKIYQNQVVKNAKKLAQTLMNEGIGIVSGGTDNHLMLCKTDSVGLSGKKAETTLERAGITCNKNMIPNDQRSPFVTSGIRLGTPAMTTRGLKEEHMELVAKWIVKALKNSENESVLASIRKDVLAICQEFPVYR